MASISRSVGVGGCNDSEDVMTLQYLLNCIPMENGGPCEELYVDGETSGRNWTATCEGIRRYQKRCFNGWSDGRVDPGGKTIGRMNMWDPASPAYCAGGGGGSKGYGGGGGGSKGQYASKGGGKGYGGGGGGGAYGGGQGGYGGGGSQAGYTPKGAMGKKGGGGGYGGGGAGYGGGASGGAGYGGGSSTAKGQYSSKGSKGYGGGGGYENVKGGGGGYNESGGGGLWQEIKGGFTDPFNWRNGSAFLGGNPSTVPEEEEMPTGFMPEEEEPIQL